MSLTPVVYRWFLVPVARSEIGAPFPDFFPKLSTMVDPKPIQVIFESEKQKKVLSSFSDIYKEQSSMQDYISFFMDYIAGYNSNAAVVLRQPSYSTTLQRPAAYVQLLGGKRKSAFYPHPAYTRVRYCIRLLQTMHSPLVRKMAVQLQIPSAYHHSYSQLAVTTVSPHYMKPIYPVRRIWMCMYLT